MEKVADLMGQDAQKWMSDNSAWLTPLVTGALGAGAGYFATGDQDSDESDSDYRKRKLRNALILGGLTGGGTAALTYGHKIMSSARPDDYESPETKTVKTLGSYGPGVLGGIAGGSLGWKGAKNAIETVQKDRAHDNAEAISEAKQKHKELSAEVSKYNKQVRHWGKAESRASEMLGKLGANSTTVDDIYKALCSGKIDPNSAAGKALHALEVNGKLSDFAKEFGATGRMLPNLETIENLSDAFKGDVNTSTGFRAGAAAKDLYNAEKKMPVLDLPAKYKPSRRLRRLGKLGGGIGGAAAGIGVAELLKHMMTGD